MLRLATTEDAEEIADLDGLLFPDACLNERTIRIELQLGRGWVWQGDQGLVGYAIARWCEPVDLLRLGVSEPGKGIGACLLDAVTWAAAGVGRDVMLTVLESNHRARQLYERKGFRTVGWMPQHASLVLRRP